MKRNSLFTWGRGLLCLFLAILAPCAFSQTVATGEVSGVVLDSSGALVAGVSIVLKSVDTGDPYETQSNASGAYRIPFVKPGKYEISGTSKNLKSDIKSLDVNVGQGQRLNLQLKVQGPGEAVVVSDITPSIDSDNANIVYTLSTQQLDMLPLAGGDMVSVAYSVPGVITNNRNGNGFGNFVVQGVGATSNLFTVNGIDGTDPYLNLNNSGPTGLLLGMNELQEASIIQNAYEGQYGRQAGAQVNYVTKSGTNTFHGNAAYNYGGARLNANNFFSNSAGKLRPNLVSHQYAASFGGPVLKNKLFFFADTEGLRFGLNQTAAVVVVPSQALEKYSLASIQPAQISLYQKMFSLYDNAPGHDHAISVSNGTGLLEDKSGRLGCGFLKGTPTGTGGTFGVDTSCAQAWTRYNRHQTSEWLFSSRVDFNLSPRQRLYLRLKTDHGFTPSVNNPISPLFDVFSTQPDYEGQLSHTFMVTSRLVNNFIGAVTYHDYVFTSPDLPAALAAFPFRIFIGDGGTNGNGFASVGFPAGGYPQGQRSGQLQIVDDVSYDAGRHSLKAGVNYRYNRETDLANASLVSSGVFNFSSLTGLATGMLDDAGSYQQNFTKAPVQHLSLNNIGVYIQDHWSVRPHLRITAAVRFERSGNPSCLERCFARLIQPFEEIPKGLSLPYNESIQTGLARAFYKVETVVPQPRLGLAYSPGWTRGVVLRGGIGVFSDSYPASFISLMGGNAPNVFQSEVRTGLVNAEGAGSAPAIASASASAFLSQFASGSTLEQLQLAVAPSPFSPPRYVSVPSTLRNAKYLEWSLEAQRKLGLGNSVTVRYMGNHGHDIFMQNRNMNGSAPPDIYPNGFSGLPATTPDPRFGSVWQFTNEGYSNYDALVTVFQWEHSHSFQGQISYTWSHALDTLSNGGLLFFRSGSQVAQINPANLRSQNYSNADYDVRHNVTADLTWQIPLRPANRFLNTVLGGWSVAARANTHSGMPFSVTNNSVRKPRSQIEGSVLADVIDPNMDRNCGRTAVTTPCFKSSEFTPALSQTDFGNLPRNSFRGPGYFNADSSLYKTLPVGEGLQFTIGASAYNLFNHPNFVNPNADVSGSGFGLITSGAGTLGGPYGLGLGPSARTVVVSGKLRF